MKFVDEMQVLLLLSSLLESWDTSVVTLSNSTPMGKLTIDIVTDNIFHEEARREKKDISMQYEANFVHNYGISENRLGEIKNVISLGRDLHVTLN